MNKKQIKAGIYARVSTADQNADMQLNELRDYCKAREWKIEAEFIETASGSKDDRPKRAELIRLYKTRKINAIVVWKLDRWGRSLVDVASTLKEISEAGIDFISLKEAIDLKTAMGRAMAQLLGILAELEKEWIKERTTAGMKRYRELNAGKWGRPASVQAKKEQILALKAQGWSNHKIAKHLECSATSIGTVIKSQTQGD